MARYREAPCVYYICRGQCKQNREALQTTYCQHCDKYKARKGFKTKLNKKKANKDKYYE